MDEAEFNSCEDPQKILQWLHGSGKMSARKARLFAAGVCRGAWHLLKDVRSQQAVLVAEAYADGRARGADLDAARLAAYQAATEIARASREAGISTRSPLGDDYYEAWQYLRAANAATLAVEENAFEAGKSSADRIGRATGIEKYRATPQESAAQQLMEEAHRLQAALLRDLVGLLPFRPIRIDPSGPMPQVLALAQHLYDERDFARLPVLGTALSDAGCTDAEILGHCASPGPHTRGCWLIDLLLKKE